MYKIKTKTRVNKEILNEQPSIKEAILKDMLTDFAHIMYEKKCCKITETNSKEISEMEITIEGLVMPIEELKEVIKILSLIKITLPPTMQNQIDSAIILLTKQPII